MQESCNKRNSKVTLIAYILRLLKVPFTNKNLIGIFRTHPDGDNLSGIDLNKTLTDFLNEKKFHQE